eukprot:1160494-Pelagomonas_calceolata.AAC.5
MEQQLLHTVAVSASTCTVKGTPTAQDIKTTAAATKPHRNSSAATMQHATRQRQAHTTMQRNAACDKAATSSYNNATCAGNSTPPNYSCCNTMAASSLTSTGRGTPAAPGVTVMGATYHGTTAAATTWQRAHSHAQAGTPQLLLGSLLWE